MKRRLTELDSDPKYKNLIGKKVVFRGGDKNKVWVGKVDFIGTNPTHGKLQITINRTPVWPVDIKSLKVIPKFNNPGQEMGWFLDNNYVTHKGSDGMEYKLENTMNLKEWTESYVNSLRESQFTESLKITRQSNDYVTGPDFTVYKVDGLPQFSIKVNSSAGWGTDPHDKRGRELRLMDAGKQKATIYWKDGNLKVLAKQMHGLTSKTTWGETQGLTPDDYYKVLKMWIDMGLHESTNENNLEEKLNSLLEKNVPNDPSKWSYYKSQAKEKFDVYPSAYANAWAAKKYKAAGGTWKKESINEDLPTKEIDPKQFPNPLTNTKGFLKKGNYDGDTADDLVPTKPVSISVSNLKPSQDAIYLGKALGMAIGGVEGGDLGAVISKDNYILDGHHRYAATTFNNPSAKVGGVQADLMIGDLVPVLRAVGDAMKNKRGLEPKGGDINIFKATMDDVKAAVYDGKNMDSKFYNKEKSIAWFEKIGEKTIAQRLKMLQSKRPPSGAPARKDMPKIHPNQLGILKTLLNKGNIDVRQPYSESVNEADVKYYKTITKDEWNKTPKDYKSIIKGVKYKMFLDPKVGTILAPVKVDESVNEIITDGDVVIFKKVKGEIPKIRYNSHTKEFSANFLSHTDYYKNLTDAIRDMKNAGFKIEKHIQTESVNEAMDKSQLKKIYDNLQKGDEITIGYSSVMGGKSVGEFIVTKGKTEVGKARVERITLINKKNPRGVKYYLYQRNGFVTFAIGNLGAVINSITLKESVNEANDTYFNTASQAVDYAKAMIEKRGFEIDEDDWNTGIVQGGKYNRLRPGVGKTHSYSIGLLKNGKPQRKELQISLYGMPSGNYELTYYVN